MTQIRIEQMIMILIAMILMKVNNECLKILCKIQMNPIFFLITNSGLKMKLIAINKVNKIETVIISQSHIMINQEQLHWKMTINLVKKVNLKK